MSQQWGKTLVHNPTLGCFLLSLFVKEYQERTAKTSYPSLGKLLLVLPIVWHAPSTAAIKNRNFITPFSSVMDEAPLVLERLSERVAAYTPITGQSLNLACATGLLALTNSDERCFEFKPNQWPHGSKPHNLLPPEMVSTLLRLANWFRNQNSNQLYASLGLI